jgi:hypothetical protein
MIDLSLFKYFIEKHIRAMQPLIFTTPDRDQFEIRVAEQTKSAKIVYVHNAGYKRKTKLFFLPDNEMLDSERLDPNALFDKDHVDLEGMRDREAFNCFMTAMETQFGFVVQAEDSNGNSVRKSMRSKQKPTVINIVEDKKKPKLQVPDGK